MAEIAAPLFAARPPKTTSIPKLRAQCGQRSGRRRNSRKSCRRKSTSTTIRCRLSWSGTERTQPARERGEARIAKAEAELAEARKKLNGKPETKEAAGHIAAAQKAIGELKGMTTPFLNWAGKAKRMSFDVPTLPLFIHERLSTKAILDTLKGHRYDRTQTTMF